MNIIQKLEHEATANKQIPDFSRGRRGYQGHAGQESSAPKIVMLGNSR